MQDSNNLVYPREEEQKNPFILFFTNLLSTVKLPFPPKKNGAKAAADSQAAEPLRLSDPPGFVTFPRQNFESIKLEVKADEAGQTTNPLQVYALGGFWF